MEELNWKEIIARAKDGEEEAMEAIYLNFKDMIYNVCYRMSG
ncbi:MAG: helix-turn-helix domain-containing protein, partial [bacterium]